MALLQLRYQKEGWDWTRCQGKPLNFDGTFHFASSTCYHVKILLKLEFLLRHLWHFRTACLSLKFCWDWLWKVYYISPSLITTHCSCSLCAWFFHAKLNYCWVGTFNMLVLLHSGSSQTLCIDRVWSIVVQFCPLGLVCSTANHVC